MQLTIVPVYGAALALLFAAISFLVIRARGRVRVALGDGGDRSLQRAIRVHANFAEYVPLALLLLAFLEVQGAPRVVLHVGGLLLLLGRLSHAYGVSREPENLRFRMAGMTATFAVLIGAALKLLYIAFAP